MEGVPPPLSEGVEGATNWPAQRLLAGFRRFALIEDATYTWRHPLDDPARESIYRLVVPVAFEHDFASVPRLLWTFISPLDLGLASIYHDRLYQEGGHVTTLEWMPESETWRARTEPWSRAASDALFARIMREQGVRKLKRRLAYLAVRAAGWAYWRSEAARRACAPATTGKRESRG